LSFIFDENIIYSKDPTATKSRISQYRDYYKVKYDICKEIKPRKMVEIGVRAGYSAWAFLQATPDAEYIGYDDNNGRYGGKGGEDGSFFEWARNILSKYNYKLIELNTQSIKDLGIYDIDFFHIDGDHSKAGVMHDLDLAYNSVRIGGYILVDDVDHIDGVKRGVSEWVDNHKVETRFIKSLRGECLIRCKIEEK